MEQYLFDPTVTFVSGFNLGVLIALLVVARRLKIAPEIFIWVGLLLIVLSGWAIANYHLTVFG